MDSEYLSPLTPPDNAKPIATFQVRIPVYNVYNNYNNYNNNNKNNKNKKNHLPNNKKFCFGRLDPVLILLSICCTGWQVRDKLVLVFFIDDKEGLIEHSSIELKCSSLIGIDEHTPTPATTTTAEPTIVNKEIDSNSTNNNNNNQSNSTTENDITASKKPQKARYNPVEALKGFPEMDGYQWATRELAQKLVFKSQSFLFEDGLIEKRLQQKNK